MIMETDKQAESFNSYNNMGREMFLNMNTKESLTERMMDIDTEDDSYEDEEPIDNTQD